MAGQGQMPAWVPAIIGAVLVVSVGAVWLERAAGRRGAGTASPSTASGPSPRPGASVDTRAGSAGLAPLRLRETVLGMPGVPRFAFDPEVRGRVVACDRESRDGGRTWTPLDAVDDPSCGDVALADAGGAWQSAQASRPPGPVTAWAADRDGALYASIEEAGRRPHLFRAPSSGAWEEVPTPGDVRALAADGGRAYAVAEMFGRASDGAWEWTRWPAQLDARGVTAHGSTVVVWGREVGAARGAYLVSRDGGVTLQLGAQGPRPVWAALDPHQPSELLTVGENGQLARLRIE